ncbi:hypothetical protein CHUAL_006814 [Chamberlinius hualienensis]
MAPQLSTAFSDLLLAISCMYSIRTLMAYTLQHKQDAFNYAKTGVALILIAASLGVVKFGLRSVPTLLNSCHKYMSFLASVMGISCLAVDFYNKYHLPYIGQAFLYGSVIVMMIHVMGNKTLVDNLSTFITSAALISILIVTAVYKNWIGTLGAGVVILSGAIFQAGWRGLGFPPDDYLHYGLVVMNYCFTVALKHK